jgi:hypothetical protein
LRQMFGPCLTHQVRQVNKVVRAVHAFEQVDGVTDVVGADMGLND